MQVDEVVRRVREFVLEHFPLSQQLSLKNNDPLLINGVVDSIGILDIVSFLESEYRITIADEDLQPENFQSIDSIASFVATKLRGHSETYG